MVELVFVMLVLGMLVTLVLVVVLVLVLMAGTAAVTVRVDIEGNQWTEDNVGRCSGRGPPPARERALLARAWLMASARLSRPYPRLPLLSLLPLLPLLLVQPLARGVQIGRDHLLVQLLARCVLIGLRQNDWRRGSARWKKSWYLREIQGMG